MKSEEFMPEYIMLMGLPGSGKSTWIKAQKAKYPEKDYHVVSSDDIIEEWGMEDDACNDENGNYNYGLAFEKYAKQAMKEMNRRFAEFVKNGFNIIHDQTNMNVNSRKGKLAQAKGYDKKAVTFTLSDKEWERRFNKRKDETGKNIPSHVIKNMAASYQAPSKAEGFSDITIVRD